MVDWRTALGKWKKRESIASLRSKIERFRDLLGQNNFVLELIAEAGESLGGDLLFDIQYLRRLDEQLADAVRKVVLDLNFITDNRHAGLMDAFERSRAGVREILESRPSAPLTPYVLPLLEIDCDLSGATGEKMARLGELHRRLNCQVPDGFVITSLACLRIFERAGVADLLRRIVSASPGEAAPAREIEERLGELIVQADVPREIARAIHKALAGESLKDKRGQTYALRSSATGEDGELSFAGLHRTVLGVSPSGVLDAYRRVLASLFSASAVAYRGEYREPLESALMAVGCVRMVPAKSSGVLYSLDPGDPRRDVMIVSAAPGLGKIVVEGGGEVDRFVVSRIPPHGVLLREVPRKSRMYEIDPAGGVRFVPVPPERADRPSVSDEFLATLVEAALRIERYMKSAQDIEWAQDESGALVILQARSLRVQADRASISRQAQEAARRHRVLIANRGVIASRGIGYGRVVLVDEEAKPSRLPRDSVLVAHLSSPHLAELIPQASAVIIDIGASTGHLATITREFRVPAIMDAGEATSILANGAEITVDAEANVVYEGKVDELLRYSVLRRSSFEETREFRMLRRMLKRVSALNLRNPQAGDFVARRCETYHDIIRFAHEKAVEHFLEGQDVGPTRKSPNCRRVEMNAPVDLTVMDIGGGLSPGAEGARCTLGQIACVPLSALLEGLNTPGAWSTEPAGMDLGSFLSSTMGPSVLSSSRKGALGRNLAIASDRYLNLNLHLGYHFNQVDSYISDVRNDNYIYFRFAGGMTDIVRRSRRAKAISIILDQQDFVVETKGDFVVARLKKIAREAMLQRMKMLGLLIGFTRQMDVRMREDSMISTCVDEFLEAFYNVAPKLPGGR